MVFSALGSLCSSLNCGGFSICNSTTTIINQVVPGAHGPQGINSNDVIKRTKNLYQTVIEGNSGERCNVAELALKQGRLGNEDSSSMGNNLLTEEEVTTWGEDIKYYDKNLQMF